MWKKCKKQRSKSESSFPGSSLAWHSAWCSASSWHMLTASILTGHACKPSIPSSSFSLLAFQFKETESIHKYIQKSQALWCMCIILALRSQKQEDRSSVNNTNSIKGVMSLYASICQKVALDVQYTSGAYWAVSVILYTCPGYLEKTVQTSETKQR